MAWSEEARRAAAESRRRNAKGRKPNPLKNKGDVALKRSIKASKLGEKFVNTLHGYPNKNVIGSKSGSSASLRTMRRMLNQMSLQEQPRGFYGKKRMLALQRMTVRGLSPNLVNGRLTQLYGKKSFSRFARHSKVF